MKPSDSDGRVVREHFLLDTGPLLEFFVVRYEVESRRQWPDRTFQFHALLTPLDRDDFQKFVRANRGDLGTSSGVVTEMHRFLREAEDRCHSQQVQQDLRRRFWGLVCATFRDVGIAEETISVVNLGEDVLVEYGPVDAGLFELAKRSVKHRRRVVLTADRRLLELCLQHGLPAEYVGDRLEKFRKAV